MSVIDELIVKLQSALETKDVELTDFSDMHAGHSTLVAAATNLHLNGKIRSPKFRGLSPVNRERLVHQVLAKELHDGTVHALSLTLEET